MKDGGIPKPVQPNENNGGAPVKINSRTDNPTHPHPGKGHQKSEPAWKWYGQTPKGNR